MRDTFSLPKVISQHAFNPPPPQRLAVCTLRHPPADSAATRGPKECFTGLSVHYGILLPDSIPESILTGFQRQETGPSRNQVNRQQAGPVVTQVSSFNHHLCFYFHISHQHCTCLEPRIPPPPFPITFPQVSFVTSARYGPVCQRTEEGKRGEAGGGTQRLLLPRIKVSRHRRARTG